MGITGSLTPGQLQFFHSQGYSVMESFASEDENKDLRKRMNELFSQFDCSVSSIFSTKNQKLTIITSMRALKNSPSSLKDLRNSQHQPRSYTSL